MSFQYILQYQQVLRILYLSPAIIYNVIYLYQFFSCSKSIYLFCRVSNTAFLKEKEKRKNYAYIQGTPINSHNYRQAFNLACRTLETIIPSVLTLFIFEALCSNCISELFFLETCIHHNRKSYEIYVFPHKTQNGSNEIRLTN